MLDIKTVDGKKIDYPKQAQGFHGYYTVNATKWSVDSEGDIRDGEMLIAEPSYLSKYGRKNAALIAAAPELLALLVEIREKLCDEYDAGTTTHAAWLSKSLRAIAKANGFDIEKRCLSTGKTPSDTINPPYAVVPTIDEEQDRANF